jgi:hypothetical protein
MKAISDREEVLNAGEDLGYAKRLLNKEYRLRNMEYRSCN